MSAHRVTVIGGGLSGIAAALDCAAAGATVTLLESRGRLGGAAYSFDLDGVRADNGQHVFLRCCTEYAGLVRRLGAEAMVTMQPRLAIDVLGVVGGRVRRGRLARTGLPAPLHLAGALLGYPFLSVRQRITVAVTMQALKRVDVDDPLNDERSFGEWLGAHGADARSVATLWELITRPTLNLTCADASLAQVAQVFQVGLLGEAAAGDIGHAAVPLSEIHDVAARRALTAAGVEVRLRTGAAAIVPDPLSGFNVTLSGHDPAQLRCDGVILAVGPSRAAGLVPEGSGVDPVALRSLGESPIVNLHVVYDRPVLDVAFAAGVDTPVQWVFDRTHSAGVAEGQYLVVTLSAADEELGMSAEAITERYLTALAQLLPAARGARVLRSFVTRDHAATFRAAPGARARRPATATRLPGLVLAGAHTDTGWPATMEGAVRSGRAAARAVMSLDARHRPAATPTPAPEPLVVLTPMSIEARAVRSGAPWAQVQTVGVGPKRAARSAAAAGTAGGRAVVIAGFCGALAAGLEPGDVVLASELRGASGEPVPCADPAILSGVLHRGGMRVHVGPIASSERVVRGQRRRELQRTGALAVDMESAWLAPAIRDRPLITLRVVLDTGSRELHRPLRTLTGLAIAYRALRRACALAEEWTRALGARDVMLASPRASCAGVDRAIEIVARALEDRGAPIYVRRQIVHNAHVVESLQAAGAVFVDDVDEVPRGATVVFSAHGVSPEVRRRAGERGLEVIDATCPLVAKVHAEARRFADARFDIVLVGHVGHEEVQGTYGEAPERTHVIATAQEVGDLQVADPERVAYLTQTTLAVDETAAVVEALRNRFPHAVGPPSSDICYATQNRQDAVRALAGECDLILVVGSANSSNSRRLVEVAERAGCPGLLVEGATEIPPSALIGVRRVGVTAGASAPEGLVAGVVRALDGLGAVNVSEHRVAIEKMHFKLPPEVRHQRSH